MDWNDRESFNRWVSELPEDLEGRFEVRLGYRAMFEQLAAAIEQSPRALIAQLGESVDGEPIWAFAVDPTPPDQRGSENQPTPSTLVIAGIHAMEHIGCVTAVRLIERALSVNTPWTSRLVVVPLVNPDGFRDVCADLAAGRRKFRRKNRRGVDLNRNFEEHTVHRRGRLGRAVGRWWNSAGADALSEPEARAVDVVLADQTPRVAVSLHAFGRWIFTPWAGSSNRPAADAEQRRLARLMANAQPTKRYKILQLGRIPFFLARGAELDHFHAAGALSFLIEIGPGPKLLKPRSWFLPYAWYSPLGPAFQAEVDNVIPAVEVLATLSNASSRDR